MKANWTILETAEEADALTSEIESIVEGWYPEGRIDWDDFLDRLDRYLPDHVCCSEDWESPFSKRVKRIARKAQAE
jgi:hypothetical protein